MTETETLAAVNVLRLVGAFVSIERNPEMWDQGKCARRTECGTTFCFFGWVCVNASFEPVWMFGQASLVRDPATGYAEWVFDTARDLLGLTNEAADRLFAGENTLDDLYREAAEIAGLSEGDLRARVVAAVAEGP